VIACIPHHVAVPSLSPFFLHGCRGLLTRTAPTTGTNVVGMECMADKFDKANDKIIMWWINPGQIDIRATATMMMQEINTHLPRTMVRKI
jgi:hypothetical protein